MIRLLPAILFVLIAGFASGLAPGLAGPALAQSRQPSHCIALSQSAPGLQYLRLADFRTAPAAGNVRLNYIAHSTFLVQTAGGLNAATDFTGFLGNVDLIPDVVTMNRAHESHFTAFPDPSIPHALRGWAEGAAAADHYLDLGEMLVRNVPTDIRGGFDGGFIPDGNSIFVFEVAGLCIGHLGHLHHEPTPAQYAALGRLDVVMAAVDGGMTLDLPTMIRVLGRLRASIILPMHWFGQATLTRFLSGIGEDFAVEFVEGSAIKVSLSSLPRRPTVMVLRPEYLQ